MDQLNHWRYFLSLEKEFCDSLRYVEYVESQQAVFSFEFARLLILVCSELDVVFKVACDSIDGSNGADSIGEYYGCVSSKYEISSEIVKLNRFSEIVRPFADWTKDAPPYWWTAQNKVKHKRHEQFHQATLHNTMCSISGLFIANLIVLNEYSLIRSVHELPVVLGRDSEPGALLLESSYRVNLH